MKKLLLILPAILLFSACSLIQINTGTPTPTPPPVPVEEKVEIQESKFSLTLPAGWKANPTAALWADAKEKFYYEDTEGNYFQVNIDPMGSDFAADSVWRYKKATETTISILEESPLCKIEDGFCAAGDNKLTIYALSEHVGEVKLGGHDYYFLFGNSKKESGVNTQIFRDIFESFNVK